MTAIIHPGLPRGTVAAPASKSCTHRLLIGAALAGDSRISGILRSEDTDATADCLRAFGANLQINGNDVECSHALKTVSDHVVLPCRESGSTLRFLIPLAAAFGADAEFTGSARLMERGAEVYRALFAQKGLEFITQDDRIRLRGRLKPGEFIVPGGISSQFISGLLFALPLLDGDSRITLLPPVESKPYMDLTVSILNCFGIKIIADGKHIMIPGRQKYIPAQVTVEGDWTNAAALLAFNTIGGRLEVTGLAADSAQGDKVCTGLFRQLEEGVPTIDLSDCPDLGPVLFSVAALHNGAFFTGTRRLRLKESDRVSAMAEELAKFGVEMQIGENTVRVFPAAIKQSTVPLCAHNDHRIAMALCLPAAVTGAQLDGAPCVSKSFPDYFDVLRQLGLNIEIA